MATEVYLYSKRVYDFDDVNGQVNALASTNDQKIVFANNGLTYIRTRTGRKARLAFVGNAVDAGGEPYITFHIVVNGAKARPPYDSFQLALGVTYDGSDRLQVPVDLPQNAMVEVIVDNSNASAFNAYIRIRIEYEDN